MEASKSRRAFLRTAVALAVTAPYLCRFGRAAAADRSFDPSFGTATDAARAIRAGAISSRELTEHVFARIRKHNGRINAFVTLVEEQAMQRAMEADAALAKGNVWGPLHGVPVLMKDLHATAGIRTTYGSKRFEHNVPTQDTLAAARLLGAGAIIVGKTNTPEFGADHQTFNEVAGTTNNPWDPQRSPGGSTGGGAAALAAGLGFLELGNDLGGSIRNPSHFCGIYGHKPSFELVPRDGPLPPGAPAASRDNQWVNGPMARSAHDLRFALALLAGPPASEAVAYRLELPAPRAMRLKDYRIGYVLSDPFCPPDSEVSKLLAGAVEAIGKQGARLSEGFPSGVDLQRTHDNWFFLAVNSWYVKEEDIRKRIESLKGIDDYYMPKVIEALSASYHQWRLRDGGRLEARGIWQEYFRDHDAFLMPANFSAAFPHDQRKNWTERAVITADGKRPYRDIGRWISIATYSGCPATVAPIGRTSQGLPVGIQIMGPFLEDATPIGIAGLLADLLGGFEPPPGYSA
jgi:amidase